MKKGSSTQQVLVMAGCMLRTEEQAGNLGDALRGSMLSMELRPYRWVR